MRKRLYAIEDSSMFYRTIKSHTDIDIDSLKSCFLVIEGRHQVHESTHKDLKLRSSFNEPTRLHTLYYPSLMHAYTLYQLHLNRDSSTYQF